MSTVWGDAEEYEECTVSYLEAQERNCSVETEYAVTRLGWSESVLWISAVKRIMQNGGYYSAITTWVWISAPGLCNWAWILQKPAASDSMARKWERTPCESWG